MRLLVIAGCLDLERAGRFFESASSRGECFVCGRALRCPLVDGLSEHVEPDIGDLFSNVVDSETDVVDAIALVGAQVVTHP